MPDGKCCVRRRRSPPCLGASAARQLVILLIGTAGLVVCAIDVAMAREITGPVEPQGSAAALPGWALAAVESLRGTPPLVFFSALVVATFLPLPVGVFYLTAGVVYGIGPALAWIAGALVVSNLVIHSASKGFLRPSLEALVARRGQRIPRFDSPLDEALFITLIRLTPGIPYFLQNVILAVADLDRTRFVGLSVGIQMVYVTGFVVLGRSIFDGELVWVAGGLALLVAIAVGARVWVRRRAGDADRV